MTGGLKPYPKYKDSGTEWLGKVPTSWQVRSLGSITQPKNALVTRATLDIARKSARSRQAAEKLVDAIECRGTNGQELMDGPRTLRDDRERRRRKELLDATHMAPLVSFVELLRSKSGHEVPDFDPLDGGINAELLFLFEKPGPMTSSSGFISRNNDDATAEATYRFMIDAGIPRTTTLIWNAVPWWDGTRKMSGEQLRDGLACLDALLGILPKVRGIVLVGRKAQRARQHIELPAFASDHPSPLVRARYPERWATIPIAWKSAQESLAQARSAGVPPTPICGTKF